MTDEQLLQSILKAFPEAQPHPGPKDMTCVRIPKEQLLELCYSLKNKPEWEFNYLLFMTSIDWKGPVNPSGYVEAPTLGGPSKLLQAPVVSPKDMPFRDAFELIYAVKSLSHNRNLVISLEIPRSQPEVPSVVSIWAGADWQEREIYDLMGITFIGHPNLKRILTPPTQQGHPLRKDYVHQLDKYD